MERRASTAVSALHAETSREVFRSFFPRWPKEEIPIRHVTNGVHVPSWDSTATDELWTNACGADRWRGAAEGLEAAIAAVDDRTLWAVRARAREELVHRARARLRRQLARRGASPEQVEVATRVLDPDVLTLGFARRFAEYKRPNLLLRNEPALRRLLLDPAAAGPAPDRRQGAPRRRAKARRSSRPGCASSSDRRGPHALRLPGRLRPLPGAGARPGRGRLDQHPQAPLGGLRHQRHEGAGQRRTQPLGARRMVGGGLRAGRRLGDRRSACAERRRARRRGALSHPAAGGRPVVLRARRRGPAARLAATAFAPACRVSRPDSPRTGCCAST